MRLDLWGSVDRCPVGLVALAARFCHSALPSTGILRDSGQAGFEGGRHWRKPCDQREHARDDNAPDDIFNMHRLTLRCNQGLTVCGVLAGPMRGSTWVSKCFPPEEAMINRLAPLDSAADVPMPRTLAPSTTDENALAADSQLFVAASKLSDQKNRPASWSPPGREDYEETVASER